MGTGYTRQSTYTDGDTIKANDTNDEFNQLLTVFTLASGHTHDGSVTEGGYVPLISDATNTDKLEIIAGGARTTGDHDVTGSITVTGTVDGRDVATDGTKLDGIETAATADQTAVDIRGLGFFDITNDGTGSGLDADLLDGQQGTSFVRSDADTTVNANVTFADTEELRIGTGSDIIIQHTGTENQVKIADDLVVRDSGSTERMRLNDATGELTLSGGIDITGNMVVSGTVDGRDIAADGATLDAIDPYMSIVTDVNFAASPFSATITNNGHLLQVDTSSGNVVVNLPDSTSLSADYRIAVSKMTADANTITINRAGTDTINNGATFQTIATAYEKIDFVLDQSTGTWLAAGGAASTINATSVVYDNTSSGLTATTSQDAIDEIDSNLDGLAASSVSFSPTGNIAATDVQAAIAEVDTEKQETLVSSTNIKTVNGITLLGSGDLSAGSLALTSGASFSGVSSVELDLPSTYENYKVVLRGLSPSNNGTDLRFKIDLGGVLETSGYDGSAIQLRSAPIETGMSNDSEFDTALGLNSTNPNSVVMDINTSGSASGISKGTWSGIGFSSQSDDVHIWAGTNTNSGVISSITFNPALGTFSGEYRVYGLED